MVRRNNNRRFKRSRRGGPRRIQPMIPGSVTTNLYHGSVKASGSVDFTYNFGNTNHLMRVSKIFIQFSSSSPSKCQLMINSAVEIESKGILPTSSVSPIYISGPTPKFIKLKQPASSDWVVAGGQSGARLGSFNNLGTSDITYVASVILVQKTLLGSGAYSHLHSSTVLPVGEEIPV